MDFTSLILTWLKENAIKIMSVPTLLSSVIFISNIVLALSDGIITEEEFHSLVSMASGIQTIILIVVMAILKIKR